MLIELSSVSPQNEYMLKVENESPAKRWEISPKLKWKIPDSHHCPFEMSKMFPVFIEFGYADNHYILFSL